MRAQARQSRLGGCVQRNLRWRASRTPQAKPRAVQASAAGFRPSPAMSASHRRPLPTPTVPGRTQRVAAPFCWAVISAPSLNSAQCSRQVSDPDGRRRSAGAGMGPERASEVSTRRPLDSDSFVPGGLPQAGIERQELELRIQPGRAAIGKSRAERGQVQPLEPNTAQSPAFPLGAILEVQLAEEGIKPLRQSGQRAPGPQGPNAR